ncbi:MAG: bifunctional salicylyl-CoA 5-hydroxylase/oxidoreductase [Candidatus Eisenbacteria bacterium]|nr:bifunctional salicylyl-CoA 5-hydroxylase/oxidoreductase [Candidatus Eisenbacteria bacterium]
MRTHVLGGGPAGLYLGILRKRGDPAHQVTIFERNRPGDTFGWGVVFSDQTLGNLKAADEPTYEAILNNFAHWDDIDIHFKGRTITSSGHGFCGISRHLLVAILQKRAAELGVDVRYQTEVADLASLHDADLIVAADGVKSLVRRAHEEVFRPSLDVRSARYIWLGTTRLFDAFTFIVKETPHGVFQVHAYRFDQEHSAFIVECDEASYVRAGLDKQDAAGAVAFSEALFGPWLDGHRLIHNAPHMSREPWQRFTVVKNERWYHDNIVLIGDAAHTAHFSIGSGTKLAMEDSIALAHHLQHASSLPEALEAYQTERMSEALRLQNAARNSMEWFENVPRYIGLEPEQFAYSLLTRSQRLTHENLRLRDADYVASVERWFAAGKEATPPMFTPYRLRDMELTNRIVVAPMDMYSATDGMPGDFHLVHLGGLAMGGAGLIHTEMTCTSPEGRITPGCTGIWNDEQAAAWKHIVDFVHGHGSAKICLQLGHCGRKGSTNLMWVDMDGALPEGNWPVIAPSPIPYKFGMQMPREMSRGEMDRVRAEFVNSVRFGLTAGFDMIELHAAHGYLLSSFITPISNQRADEYGGSLENRLRYPLEVFRAMRAEWPKEKPMSVRISASDWVAGGLTTDESVAVARALHEAGADIIHVSTGLTSGDSRPVYGRLFQTPFSDRIRNEGKVPTITVGNITAAEQVNMILAGGRADLVALARPHLADPHWTLRAAAELGFTGVEWTPQYQAGRLQMERELGRKGK